MPTVHQPPVSDTDPPPPPGTTPYFLRPAAYRKAYDQAAAGRGLPPRSWAA